MVRSALYSIKAQRGSLIQVVQCFCVKSFTSKSTVQSLHNWVIGSHVFTHMEVGMRGGQGERGLLGNAFPSWN